MWVYADKKIYKYVALFHYYFYIVYLSVRMYVFCGHWTPAHMSQIDRLI